MNDQRIEKSVSGSPNRTIKGRGRGQADNSVASLKNSNQRNKALDSNISKNGEHPAALKKPNTSSRAENDGENDVADNL